MPELGKSGLCYTRGADAEGCCNDTEQRRRDGQATTKSNLDLSRRKLVAAVGIAGRRS
jgi:hypothetical protein